MAFASKFRFSKLGYIGAVVTEPRKKMHAILKELDGEPKESVGSMLDYLVIGAQSSPCWFYSTYRRKIEKTMNFRKEGTNIIILHNTSFIDQLKEIQALT